MGDGEILQLPLTQLLADDGPVPGAVQIQAQEISFATLPLTGVTRLLMATGTSMPALALDLLTQILLQLQGQSALTAAQPFSHPLQIVGAHRRLRQFAQQIHQSCHRLLELIRLGQIALIQRLFDLPVQPERGLIEQGAIVAGAVILEELIRILPGREMQHPQFQLALHRQLLHLADGTVGGTDSGTVSVEIENDPLAVTDATELGDLLIAQRSSQRSDGIGDSSGVKRDHIEVALDDHGPVVLADRVGGLVEAEQMLALFEQLRFRGVEIFGFAAVEAAATEADHPSLTVVNRHHHPMTEAVVEAVAPLAGNHKTGGFQKLGGKTLHLLQVLEQTVPLVRGVTQLKGLLGGQAQAAGLTEIGLSQLSGGTEQLSAEPAGSQGQNALQFLPARQLLAQPFLLRTIDRLDGNLVTACKVENDIAEALSLELHQELDGVAAGTAGEAVIELLRRRNRHRRFAVVVKRTDPNELTALFLEHHVLADHVDDVRPFLDGVNRAGVEPGRNHGSILRSRRMPSNKPKSPPIHGRAIPGLVAEPRDAGGTITGPELPGLQPDDGLRQTARRSPAR